MERVIAASREPNGEKTRGTNSSISLPTRLPSDGLFVSRIGQTQLLAIGQEHQSGQGSVQGWEQSGERV